MTPDPYTTANPVWLAAMPRDVKTGPAFEIIRPRLNGRRLAWIAAEFVITAAVIGGVAFALWAAFS